jgi:hypothetical protein
LTCPAAAIESVGSIIHSFGTKRISPMPMTINGDTVDCLHTTDALKVKVELNDEAEAQAANKGKKAPQHYENIKTSKIINFKSAVVVQQGSIIQFKITSRGAFGFGYRILGGVELDSYGKVVPGIKSQQDTIVRQLYCVDKSGTSKDTDRTDIVRRYQNDEHSLIKVQDFKSVGGLRADTGTMAAMMSCTVHSWGVYGFIDDATDIDYGHPADIGRENEWGPYKPTRLAPGITASAAAGASARATASSLVAGGPTRFGTSSQEFAFVRQIRQDNPDAAPHYVNFTILIEK